MVPTLVLVEVVLEGGGGGGGVIELAEVVLLVVVDSGAAGFGQVVSLHSGQILDTTEF